jgi:nitroimidazol reductase NimA-like FMN-containing flavoprotein (pyridoxamine 5'-phosphate oxidase superfamily)
VTSASVFSDDPCIPSLLIEVDRNGLEILDRDDYLRLLATPTLGRIGVTSRSLPAVLPVNIFLDGERILVRTGVGSKLDAATQNAVVAFEMDDFDPMDHSERKRSQAHASRPRATPLEIVGAVLSAA